jgi:HAD superfamily hydrolase (TIGR01490 family)
LKKKIAFFDFDGTITKKDTLLEFIKFSKGTLSFYLGFLINSPYLVAYKLKLISNQEAKEKVLQFFFKNMPVEQFQVLCDQFSQQVLPRLIRAKALEEIEKLKSEGVLIVVVSASPEYWIRKWAGNNSMQTISTRLEIKDGKLTGKILGKNCHGEEKVIRIQESFVLSEYEKIFAYGDSSGDKPMIKLASDGYYKPFR